MPEFLFDQSRPIGSDTYVLATWLFLRALGVIYLIAFVSLRVQALGLVGGRGILPIGSGFPAAAGQARFRAFLRKPTLLLWDPTQRGVKTTCTLGIILSVLLILGVAPIPVLVALWLLYLSLLHVCGVFLGFQWDILLLEVGFLTIFLAPVGLLVGLTPEHTPMNLARIMAVWLLFRLVFSSGVVKLRSGDKTWRDLTAMCYHYETQPLPNRIAWYAHHQPRFKQKLSTLMMFAIELVVPFGLFFRAPVNQACALAIVGLMVLIFLTGNYCFFNLLTIALCIWVFDDATLLAAFDALGSGWQPQVTAVAPPAAWQIIACLVAVLLALLSIDPMVRLYNRRHVWRGRIGEVLAAVRPFLLVSGYGLFANMTTRRPEIVVEGSRDGMNWKAYEFRYKPGDLKVSPRQVAPHQPRLDWQMWFAALGRYQMNLWLVNLMTRLTEGSPQVLKLLKTNPFADQPPTYVRALLYDYHFTDPAERRATGNWWKRKYLGQYCPTITNQRQAYPYYTPPPNPDV